MFKKIVFYLLVATSLYVVAMEDKEITLASDYSNWRKVFELYKISIPKTQNYIEKNGEGNLYAYWVDELLTLKSPKNLSQEMFNKVVFLKITCDIFPSYKKIGYFSEDNQFSPWLHITDIDQLNAFGNMVCNNSSSNYFYLIVGTQLHFFYDPFALWYMRIRDLDKRKEYVTNYSTFLNMQALDVPKVQKNFFNIGALPVRAIRKYFMDPNGFFNNVMVPVCKNDPQLKSNFLSKFVDSFLSMYNPEKQGIRTFIYAYCSFFNHIFHIVTSEEIRQNLKEIANKFPGQTEKVLENSDLFLLYDKNDIISILYLTGGLEGVKTKEIRKNDALAWMKKFASAKEDNDDLKSVLVIIIAHCIPSLLDLYEGDPIGLKEFLETIGNQDYKKEMEKAVIEKPDEKNKMIQKEDPNFFEKPIPIEIRSGSLGLAEKIRDSKNNPNPLDKLLSQEFSDRQIRKEYKEVVLSVAKVESSVYFANMKYLFDLAKTKTVSGKKVMSEDDIKLMLAYWMNSAAIQSDQSIGNIKVIAQFLNENILDLNLKEELANILCVPGTNYYWFWDNKKIVIDHSIFMSAPTSPDEKAKRIAFMRNYVLFNNDDNIRKRFSDSAGFVKALNELKLTDDQLKQFLTEYIQSFLAYHEKSFVFGYAKFFSDLIINSSFRFTYQDQENLFEPFLKTAQLLYRDGTSNQPEILQDPRDFLSFVSGKSHDLSRDIEDFLMAVAKNDVYKKQFSDLFFSENIDREDLSYRVNKLISFLYAHKAEDKLQYINAFLKIYAFKRYDGLYKSFFHAIQRALKDTFNCNAEYKVIRDGKNLSHVQFTLKSDSNNELFKLLNMKYTADNAKKFYDLLYKNGQYQWTALSEKLQQIIEGFEGEDQTYLNDILKDIVDQIVKIDPENVSPVDQEFIDNIGTLVKIITKHTSLDMEVREKLANYYCELNRDLYVILNDEQEFVYKESPLAYLYRDIKDIYQRSDFDKKSNFMDKDEEIIKDMLTWGNQPEKFVESILNLVSDKFKINFLKMYIENFNKKSETLFLFGYIKFFNSIFDTLKITDLSVFKEFNSLIAKNYTTVKLMAGGGDGKYELDDRADFFSTWLYKIESSSDISKLKSSNDISKFIKALGELSSEKIQSMQSAFLRSKDLKQFIVRFLVSNDIQNDDGLKYLNEFLRKMYSYQKGVKVAGFGAGLTLKSGLIEKDVKVILGFLDSLRSLKDVEYGLPEKDDNGNYYYQFKFKESPKPKEEFIVQPLVQPKITISSEKPVEKQSNQPTIKVEPIESEEKPSRKLVQNIPNQEVGQSGQQQPPQNTPVSPIGKISQTKENVLPMEIPPVPTNTGWSILGVLKAIGSFLAWPFVTLWAWLNE